MHELCPAANMSRLLVLVFCLSLSLCLGCPDGWVQHGFSCYFFSYDAEPWVGASDLCETFGGNLVEVETAEEDHYLSAQVKLRNTNYWIGLTDLVQDSTWQWMTSKDLIGPTGFTRWAPGQPENTTNNIQNCVSYLGREAAWNDLECYQHYRFICEQPADATSVVG